MIQPATRFRHPGSIAAGLLTLMLALLFCTPVCMAVKIPPYEGYVNDYAGLLPPSARNTLEHTLADFDRTDSTQIAVLTVDSLEGETVETYGIQVADAWKIGRQGKDNGVLLLIAKKERKIRIEVGYGLEGRLTDLLSGRIIDQIITPSFRRGNYEEGIVNGVTAIIGAVKGEFANPNQSFSPSRPRKKGSPLFSYLIFGLFFIAFLGNISRKLGVLGGSLLLPIVFFAGPASFSFLLLLLLVSLGAGAGLLLPLLLSASAQSRTYYRGGGFGGGFGGGSGGFGGGGFGGFGGGGFGGGGASGGW